MSQANLTAALRQLSQDIYAARDEATSTTLSRRLDHAALGLEVLAHIVDGKSVSKSFGAPGDWGYGTPIATGLLTMLRAYPAHLITQEAAPELLAALKAALPMAEKAFNSGADQNFGELETARAAIAKAEGRSP